MLTTRRMVLCGMLALLIGVAGFVVCTVGTPSEAVAAQCSSCKGTGYSSVQCFPCNGKGKTRNGNACAFCNGTGWKPCANCKGTGQR